MSRASVLVAAIAVAAAGLAFPATQAAAQTNGLDVTVRGTDLQPDGTSEVTVTVGGVAPGQVLAAGSFSIVENGVPIEAIAVEPITVEQAGLQVSAGLALDTSSSMRGELIDSIKVAGAEMVRTLTEQDIPVTLLEFNTTPAMLSPLTTDADALIAAIDGLEATGMTALYDAVIAGVAQLQDAPGITSLIVLADGEDNASDNTLDDAIRLAEQFGVPITVVAYETDRFEPEVLRPLADGTDGRFITADDASQFDAIFQQVAADVTSQYRITYASDLVDAGELEIALTVRDGGREVTQNLLLINPRVEAEVVGLQPPQAVALFDSGPLGTETALVAALGVAFLALVLFLGVLLLPRGDKDVARTLRRSLTLTQRRAVEAAPTSGLSASAISERALALISSAPKPEGFEDRLQVELDRAGWQLRASEFLAFRIGGAVAGLALTWALTGRWWFGLVGAVAGAYVPTLLLLNAKQRRLSAFSDQLPDTLQLLSGTLKAGYGLLQGIDTIVKETEDPMASEFQRVLTEARLGLPIEESLNAMADRVDSDDFRWVVVAMNIQRTVGGNLAELLETVSETLRGREAVRRQINVLSAEGKLSAVILVALPFLLLAYMLVVNPAYLAPLVTTFFGLLLSAGAVVLMILGVIWMQKMIKIDV